MREGHTLMLPRRCVSASSYEDVVGRTPGSSAAVCWKYMALLLLHLTRLDLRASKNAYWRAREQTPDGHVDHDDGDCKYLRLPAWNYDHGDNNPSKTQFQPLAKTCKTILILSTSKCADWMTRNMLLVDTMIMMIAGISGFFFCLELRMP